VQEVGWKPEEALPKRYEAYTNLKTIYLSNKKKNTNILFSQLGHSSLQ
jgi:hypothetical protein